MAPEIPDPFLVDYAPTGRGLCKTCKATIPKGSVRFGRKVRSPWHDGFDIQYRHFKCGYTYATTIEEISGLEHLQWKDVVKCSTLFGKKLDESHPIVEEYRKRNDALWELRTQLESIPLAMLKAVLEANGYAHLDRLKASDAAALVADGMLLGKTPKCPICDQITLEQVGTLWKCRGFLEGSSARCQFQYRNANLFDPDIPPDNQDSDVSCVSQLKRTEPFVLTPECEKIPALRKWKPPKGVLTTRIKSGRQTAFNSEDEEDIPKGRELVGLEFCAVGATVPPRQELEDLIVQHGGVFNRNLASSVSYFLVGEVTPALKTTKRFQDALKLGLPILDSRFVPALCSYTPVFPEALSETKGRKRVAENLTTPTRSKKRVKLEAEDDQATAKGRRPRRAGSSEIVEEPVLNMSEKENFQEDRRPKGWLLRQRKYAKYYLLAGKMPPSPFATVKSILAAQSAAQKVGTKLTKRNVPQAGSPILQLDPMYDRKSTDQIYVDQLNNVYNAPTVFTDITTGINKFYNIQLVTRQKAKGQSYTIFRRWGRVGGEGRANDFMTEEFDSDLIGALESFKKRFKGLTGLDWDERYDCPVVAGRYKFVQLSDTVVNHLDVKTPLGTEIEEDSKLSKPLYDLVALIFDRQMMERVMERQHLDMRAMPLGKISRAQLDEAYDILRTLQTLIVGSKGSTSDTTETLSEGSHAPPYGSAKWKAKITAATNAFYTTIPHQFSLKQTPPLLDTTDKLHDKILMLEQLLDISVADSIMSEALTATKVLHPLDRYYEGLECKLEALDPQGSEFQLIQTALANTHGATHTGFELEMTAGFACHRRGERERCQAFLTKHAVDNRKLLWHGSRLTNWVGILKNGLRIAPKEAPVTGYMFGKGVYFADMASKASQYCFADTSSPEGLLVLCEVALGEPYMRLAADENAHSACRRKGCLHTWGIGRNAPDPEKIHMLDSVVDNKPVALALGTGISTEDAIQTYQSKHSDLGTPSLLYNEYIVYDVSQIVIRYIVRVTFTFKSFDTVSSSSTSSSSDSSNSDDNDDEYNLEDDDDDDDD